MFRSSKGALNFGEMCIECLQCIKNRNAGSRTCHLLSAFHSQHKSNDQQLLAVSLRNYSNSNQGTTASIDKNLKAKEKKTKTVEIPKIMLISESDNVSLVTLVEAEKIARKKGFYLEKIDSKEGKIKTDKQLYKMTRHAPYTGSTGTGRGQSDPGKPVRKEEKTLILHTKIAEHDVLSKVNSILKWIKKGHEVRVYIGPGPGGKSGDAEASKTKAESIYRLIESNVKEFARIVQKREKGLELRFQILPLPSSSPSPTNEKGSSTISSNKNSDSSPD